MEYPKFELKEPIVQKQTESNLIFNVEYAAITGK